MYHLRPLRFIPVLAVLLLAACDAADPGASGAFAPATADAHLTPLDSLTFFVGGDMNQSFQLENFALVFDTTTYFLSGGVHFVIDIDADDLGGFDVRGHANAQGLYLEPEDSSALYRVVGSSNLRGNVAADDTTAFSLRFRAIGQGQLPDYHAFLDLEAYPTDEGDGVNVVLSGARLEEF